MGFASAWLAEKTLFPQFIAEPPEINTGIIIVVPAYNEPGITTMLDSLGKCTPPSCGVEVIIVINAPADSPPEHLEQNRSASEAVHAWNSSNPCFLKVYSILPVHSFNEWGVGLARKTGMDEALRRFDTINRPGGVILCLDADCTVDPDYLVSVNDELLDKKNMTACSIYFEHPLSGTEFNSSTYNSIVQYELHLRYYLQALAYTGFPYVFHTVGSAMAVKAMPYMKSGGMNRRQAGEDFYFIQKIVPAGGYFYLTSTTVYPSPRISFRVPFGTGATMEKLSAGESPVLKTYNPEAFLELRELFRLMTHFSESNDNTARSLYPILPEGVKKFIAENEWVSRIDEISENTSGPASFRKRFFGWFNMFRIVKYLNYVHMDYFDKKPVADCARELLMLNGIAASGAEELLRIYRSFERNQRFFLDIRRSS
jgi:glycosyltransferase involved in cell wall biosynthesis